LDCVIRPIDARLVIGDASELCAQAPVFRGELAGAFVEQRCGGVKNGKVGFTPPIRGTSGWYSVASVRHWRTLSRNRAAITILTDTT